MSENTERRYLKWYNKVGYGSGDVAGNVVYAFLSSFVMIYLTDTVGLNPGIVGTLIAVSKLFDGLTDVFFGSMIDKTHSKLGKARPWMLYGYIGCAITLVGIFAIPMGMSEFAKYAWFFICYSLLNAVFYTANNIAYSALTSLVTKNSAERVEMGSYRFMFAFATSLAIQSFTLLAVSALGDTAEAWRTVAIVYAIIGLIVNTLSVFSVKELPEEEFVDTTDVEVFMRDESRYVRISPDGLKYIRSTQKDALDVDKRAAMKRRIKGEQGRLTRVETTLCMCRAAGIQPAKEASIKLIDVLDPEQDAAQTFMNDFFYDKGLLFLSDEISATIKTSTTMGEEYTLGQSRLVGIVINRTGISFLYCTLDKLMRWVVSYEQRRVSAVMELLKSSSLAATDEDFATICNMSPKCIVIGKTCAIVPKIITGDKYGKAIDSTDIIKTHNATRLLTLTNLEQVYKYSYFVPTSSIGVELLTRTAALTRNELNEMISVWLDEMAESHTTVTTGRYVEAYINEQK